MEANIRSNAELVRKVANDQIGVSVNYDEAGVQWLDKYIDGQRIGASEEVKSKLPSTLGSFLGECVRHTYGGEWVHDLETGSWMVKINDKMSVFPFAKVRKQLAGGDGDSVLGLFSAIESLLKNPPLHSALQRHRAPRPWWQFWRSDAL